MWCGESAHTILRESFDSEELQKEFNWPKFLQFSIGKIYQWLSVDTVQFIPDVIAAQNLKLGWRNLLIFRTCKRLCGFVILIISFHAMLNNYEEIFSKLKTYLITCKNSSTSRYYVIYFERSISNSWVEKQK